MSERTGDVRYEAEDLRFPSGDLDCGATLYRPVSPASQKLPCVVMGNGVSLTRNDGVPRFAERLARSGIAALTFDFAHLGDSEGEPRQLIDSKRQLQDFAAAVAFARSLAGLDATKVAVWGYSLGGGVALSVAAQDHQVAAAVLLCPMVDGLAFSFAAGFRNNMVILGDALRATLGRRMVQLPAVGRPGSRALLTQEEAVPDFEAIVGTNSRWQNLILAKPSQPAFLFRPVRAAHQVTCPVLVCAGSQDTMVPQRPIERLAARAPSATLRLYSANHADAFCDRFEEVASDQAAFLVDHLMTATA